jgi:hypothetical protein
MSQYFNETLYNELQQSEMTFPTFEMLPVDEKALAAKLSHIYNKDQFTELSKELGTSLYHH